MRIGQFGLPRLVAGVAALVGGLVAFAAPAGAAPVPVEVNLTALRPIQTYNLDKKGDDQAYMLVTGVAKGQPINERFPKDKAWDAARKKQPVTEKSPLSLWKGDLDDGEFALVTVSTFQGTGEDQAKTKEYLTKLADAEKAAAGTKTLASPADFKKLATDTVKSEQAFITKIKDLFSREKKTDHYGGLFNVLVWNNKGKIVKRIDPVGLTFGEHYGTDVKVYTKLKNTLNNALVQDDKGQWSEMVLSPLSDDFKTIRVKMLENEFVKLPDREVKNTTDYLADVQVLSGGKPLNWQLEGEETGVDDKHTYWNWAD